MDSLVRLIPEGIAKAKGSMEAAKLEFGTGKAHINVNRRFPVDGGIQMRPNSLRIVDQRVKVAHFVSKKIRKINCGPL